MPMEPQCPVLPDDVIEDIFTRLPASLVVGCRSLSRTWAAVLSSDDFVDRHRRAANRYGGPRFFIFQSLWTIKTTTTTAHAWLPARPLDGVVPLPRMTTPLCYPQIITLHCRGLILVDVGHVKGSRHVYNPSSGHIALLPPCHWNAGRHHPAQRRYESFGLGYDARSGKHKVVRIYYRGAKIPVLVQVYVLDEEGFWRAPKAIGRPEATKPPGWVSEYERTVFAHGHVHWMAQKQKPMTDSYWRVTRRGIIVSFSVADEAFGVVPLPPRVDYFDQYRLTELEGLLCLFNPIVDIHRVRRSYDLWLLHDHESGAWELRCRIDPNTTSPEVAWYILSRKASPLAFMDDGRRILFMKKSFFKRWTACLFAYTPATGDVEHLPYNSNMCPATLYEENVVSPGRPHEDILFSPAATQALCVVLGCRPPAPCDLMHLKFVCRSWRALIESTRFVKLLKARAETGADQVLAVLLKPPRSSTDVWGNIWYVNN